MAETPASPEPPPPRCWRAFLRDAAVGLGCAVVLGALAGLLSGGPRGIAAGVLVVTVGAVLLWSVITASSSVRRRWGCAGLLLAWGLAGGATGMAIMSLVTWRTGGPLRSLGDGLLVGAYGGTVAGLLVGLPVTLVVLFLAAAAALADRLARRSGSTGPGRAPPSG
jgi:hypothetical protein